jgi:heme/copper-type cytochrome/quinol oxidase subunit 2
MSFINTSKDVIMLLLFLIRFKSDAVPGRLNQYHVILTDRYLLWPMFELCGVNHAFMHYKLFLSNSN